MVAADSDLEMVQVARVSPRSPDAVLEYRHAWSVAQGRGDGDRQLDHAQELTEKWELDRAHGYRFTSHRYAFTFRVPFRGRDITVSQEVRADNRGVFGGSVALPSGVK